MRYPKHVVALGVAKGELALLLEIPTSAKLLGGVEVHGFIRRELPRTNAAPRLGFRV